VTYLGVNRDGIINRESLNVTEILPGELGELKELGLKDGWVLAWLRLVLTVS